MKTGIKRERKGEGNGVRRRRGGGGFSIQAKQGRGWGLPFKYSPEGNFRGGEERGWDGGAWKTATSHRHHTSQERLS